MKHHRDIISVRAKWNRVNSSFTVFVDAMFTTLLEALFTNAFDVTP